jgi:hypothetical protein
MSLNYLRLLEKRANFFFSAVEQSEGFQDFLQEPEDALAKDNNSSCIAQNLFH